ncbi:PepSY domain-containing protein [Variovorax dokdonensis]|uniref:PepSY domain-containing protein n=1 Tax=Variovorax dokdonensis TaxID=344883 RepID=A0ABT7NC00_9BURK|nr:PepSY domain-containing protein [Variovorax dokdonensis]MDM0045462.1 PepSY domain-containing protein [Variovorax dokdonensis]
MPRPNLPSLPATLLTLACAALAGSALAQAPATSAPPAAESIPGKDLQREEGRQNQKIERIHIDDGGTKVDELRVGGETKDITVTPKGNMPQYEVKPTNPSRTNSQGQGEATGGTGPAVWNVLKF